MKKIISEYLLYIYLNFINDDDDFEIYKKWTVPFLKKLKFTHNVYVWIGSVIFFPILFIDMQVTELSKKIMKKDKS